MASLIYLDLKLFAEYGILEYCKSNLKGVLMAQDTQDTVRKSFKDTLNLPQTEFPIRAQPKVEDAELLSRWLKEDLYRKTFELNEGNTSYILHDGPPYANGHIHLGHAYNKVLKDIMTKSRRMMGYHVPITPGWDCHGLPIELKVLQEHPGLKALELMKACRTYAQHWIDVQKSEFRNLGVCMDWERPYITMSPSYEAATVRALGILVEHGFVERKNKTVPWCFHDETVLATAEIEYKDRKDPSVYVAFDLHEKDAKKLFPSVQGQVSVIVWTTTPWTLPLNRAVLARPQAIYVLLDLGGRYGLVGKQAAEGLCKLLGIEEKIVQEIPAQTLEGLLVLHPITRSVVPLILDDSVGLTEGTAFVHCAPGCGPLDYEIGVKNALEIYSPISSDGCYTDLIQPEELAGMKVTDGQWWVIKKLTEDGKLIYKGSITHSYPHCWRCHNGLIFRATPQWFFDLERKNIKQQVLDAIDNLIAFIPPQGRRFLRATVENRWEWCLSRQRMWGTPIPALICTSCDKAYLDQELIFKVAKGIEKEGIEYWHKVPLKDLVPHMTCSICGNTDFKKEFDILDVWLDAGVSNYAVLCNNPRLGFPADLYLEGTDQYRGWFQSSLIMSMVINQEPCTKAFMTHGFTVDEKGHKMSKSLGNVVAPQEIIDSLGTDGLRLWVASIGHESDAVVSDMLMKNIQEVNRKIRNTLRFLLSNLYDFELERDAVPVDLLLPIDHYALARLNDLNATIIQAYKDGDFTRVFHELAQYTSVELSSYYLDIVKDRLYCEGADTRPRRSVQTALAIILDTLTRLIAPIMSFTAEHVSDYYQKNKKGSIHLQPFVDPQKLHDFVYGKNETMGFSDVWVGSLVNLIPKVTEGQRELGFFTQWTTLKDIRNVLLKALEIEREKGIIKHSLEAAMTVYIDTKKPEFENLPELFKALEARGTTQEEFFAEFLIVSQFHCAQTKEGLDATTDDGIYVKVTPAKGDKCPRCWKYDETRNIDKLCHRCEEVLANN